MTVPIEFHLDNLKISDQLEAKLRAHFEDWTHGHHDISNIYISLRQVSGKKTVHEYEAKVVIYRRPEHVISTQRSHAIPESLTTAVRNAERQLREIRKVLKDKRKRARSTTPADTLPTDS